jgi:diaminopimelate decarboxylase
MPSLVFDLATIAANMRRVAEAARAVGIRPLFAAKSFPHPRVLALAGELLDGFDVASPGELRDVPEGKILSIADPSGAAIGHARGSGRGRLIVSCETLDQLRAAPPHAELAIRISASITERDPAVGAILEGSGRRSSRFGLATRDAIAPVVAAAVATGRPVGLHVHHGPVTATSAERFVATARAALALAELTPAFVDLGGAWHGIADLPTAFASVRAAIPASIELLVEPGRLYAANAGTARGRVLAARTLADRELRVVDLSRVCHLKWSQIELVAPAPRPGEGRDVLFAGPTCYEEDVLGTWTIAPAAFAPGAEVVFDNVTGYALAWNTGFGGVPPADVVVT